MPHLCLNLYSQYNDFKVFYFLISAHHLLKLRLDGSIIWHAKRSKQEKKLFSLYCYYYYIIYCVRFVFYVVWESSNRPQCLCWITKHQVLLTYTHKHWSHLLQEHYEDFIFWLIKTVNKNIKLLDRVSTHFPFVLLLFFICFLSSRNVSLSNMTCNTQHYATTV